jgi:hypothetical protein
MSRKSQKFVTLVSYIERYAELSFDIDRLAKRLTVFRNNSYYVLKKQPAILMIDQATNRFKMRRVRLDLFHPYLVTDESFPRNEEG